MFFHWLTWLGNQTRSGKKIMSITKNNVIMAINELLFASFQNADQLVEILVAFFVNHKIITDIAGDGGKECKSNRLDCQEIHMCKHTRRWTIHRNQSQGCDAFGADGAQLHGHSHTCHS